MYLVSQIKPCKYNNIKFYLTNVNHTIFATLRKYFFSEEERNLQFKISSAISTPQFAFYEDWGSPKKPLNRPFIAFKNLRRLSVKKYKTKRTI